MRSHRESSSLSLRHEMPSPIMRAILSDRGFDTPEAVASFIAPRYESLPDPFLFQDMHKAVTCIREGIAEGRVFFIHGDYDIDGISASVILARTIRKAGGVVEVFYPDRQKDGYGLRMKTVEACRQRGIGIVITCDCGIRNRSEVAALEASGIRTIVTDHHDFADDLPSATATLHPRLPHEGFPGKLLSGAGVAWMLAAALHRSEIPGLQHGQEKWLLDLAMLGTIGDMVPLREENRILATFGLKVLPQSCWPGLVLLAGEKPSSSALTSEDVSFQIIPKLNAAGRIADARIAADLLLAETAAQAMPLLDQLREINTERQRMTQEMASFGLAHSESEEPFVLLGQDHWPIGVVGLVANRIMESVRKPVLLYGRRAEDGHFVGSARSPRHIHITEALNACSDLLVEFGGHAQAAGFTITEENLLPFRERLRSLMDEQGFSQDLSPKAKVYQCALSDCTFSLFKELQQLQPFGVGNEEPLFECAATVTNVKRVGKDGAHLKIRLTDPSSKITVDGIGFFMVTSDVIPGEGEQVLVTVALRENVWNGERMVQCHVRSIETI